MVCLGWFGRITLGVATVVLVASCGGAEDEAAPPAPVVSVGIGEVRLDTMTAVTVVSGSPFVRTCPGRSMAQTV